MTLDRNAFDLTGKRALVTGAAQGIGRSIALSFARFGASLALCDRAGEELEAVAAEAEAEGSAVVQHAIDVRDDDALDVLFADVASRFGGLDVVVNNAGGGFAARFVDVSEKGELALIRENFTSVAHVIRRSVPLLPAVASPGSRSGGGSVINITSIEAHRAGPSYAIYSAMKAGVENLTKSLALELAEQHVRVNCIAPDVIPTPGVGPMPITTPLPYAGDPDDVAAVAVYLASDASRFVTGTTIHVDGGNFAGGGWRRTPDGSYRT